MIFLFVLFVTTAFALDCPQTGTTTGTNVASEPVCEGGTLNIKCDPGKLIHIIYVEWGRQDNVSCNYSSTDNTDCTTPNATTIGSEQCNNQCSCSLSANSSVWGDPCPGTNKYLVAQWECVEILECCRCEEFDVAASTCEPYCDPQVANETCTTRPGCKCKPGYLRDRISGKCVKNDRCPFYNPNNPNCTTDEVLDLCGPGCEVTCQNPDDEQCYEKDCVPGYICRRPLYRDETTGLCIPKEDCPCYCHGYDSSSSSEGSSSSSEECN